jgi:hypothetical protein
VTPTPIHTATTLTAREWPFEPNPRRDFNLRALAMSGPYGVVVSLTCAALTAGAISVHDYAAVTGQSPAAKVRAFGAGTASYPMPIPVEYVRRDHGGAGSPTPAYLNLSPAHGQSGGSLDLRTPPREK